MGVNFEKHQPNVRPAVRTGGSKTLSGLQVAKAKPFISVKWANDKVTTVKGRDAQTLAHLFKSGSSGDTSLGFSKAGWARRTSGYVHDLRKFGFDIATFKEPAEDGIYIGRYVLTVNFEIVEFSGAHVSEVLA